MSQRKKKNNRWVYPATGIAFFMFSLSVMFQNCGRYEIKPEDQNTVNASIGPDLISDDTNAKSYDCIKNESEDCKKNLEK